MARASDRSDEEIKEATKTLQQVADDVERDREKGRATTLPSDESNAETEAMDDERKFRTDDEGEAGDEDDEPGPSSTSDEDDVGPLSGEAKEVRQGNFAKLSQRGGALGR